MSRIIGKLIDQTEDLQRGQILRCKGKYPYEDVVDFMNFNNCSGQHTQFNDFTNKIY